MVSPPVFERGQAVGPSNERAIWLPNLRKRHILCTLRRLSSNTLMWAQARKLLGMNPEEIARGLDTLTLADVHGALAYYFRRQTEIDNYLRRRGEEAEKLRQEIETANASRLAPLKARLDAVKAEGNGGHAPTPD